MSGHREHDDGEKPPGGHTLPPLCWTARHGSRRVFAFHHLCRERRALLQHTTVLGVARWQGSVGCVIRRFVKRQAIRRTRAAPATSEHPAGKRPRVAIVATSIYDVFTPGKTTTITYVDRTHKNVANELRLYLRRGGKFVSVVGPTKMGKTVLVEREAPEAVVVQGQSIRDVNDLWARLAAYFEVPVGTTAGKVVSNKAKWGFFAKFGIPGIGAGGEIGGEHGVDRSTSYSTEIYADQVLPELVEKIRSTDNLVTVVLDDFHFIPEGTRREVIQALKPLAHKGASIVIVTLPHRKSEASRLVRDVGGRTETVEVEPWSDDDLAMIATKGFFELNVNDADGLAQTIASEAYGSPQIMQQLCLELCERLNQVESRETVTKRLLPPQDWGSFWRLVQDEDSNDWLRKLDSGPKQRGQSRKRHLLKNGLELDGYGVILAALRALGPRLSLTLDELNAEIARQVAGKKAGVLGVATKLGHMSAIAAKSLESSPPEVDDEDDEIVDPAAGSPQPVFEYVSEKEEIHILEPYLAYTLKWHSDELLGAGGHA